MNIKDKNWFVKFVVKKLDEDNLNNLFGQPKLDPASLKFQPSLAQNHFYNSINSTFLHENFFKSFNILSVLTNILIAFSEGFTFLFGCFPFGLFCCVES